MSVYFPQQNQNNLGSALQLWNQFNQPGVAVQAQPGGLSQALQAPPPAYGANGSAAQAPPPNAAAAESMSPKDTSWNGSDPWFGAPTTNQQGKGIAAPDTSGNLGKAAGAAGGAAGLLAAI